MQRDLLNWMDFLQHAQLPTHMCSFALGNMKIAQNQELLCPVQAFKTGYNDVLIWMIIICFIGEESIVGWRLEAENL